MKKIIKRIVKFLWYFLDEHHILIENGIGKCYFDTV